MRKTTQRKGEVDRVLGALVNVLSLVYAHFYFPTHSNGLKDVPGCLGWRWTEPEAAGVQSIVWRRRWEAIRAEGWKTKLLVYNREDCAALKLVTELVYAPAPREDSLGHAPRTNPPPRTCSGYKTSTGSRTNASGVR
jgi:predicted RecB family nuclease